MHAPSGDIRHYEEDVSDITYMESRLSAIRRKRERLIGVMTDKSELMNDELIPLSKEDHETIKEMKPIIRKNWMKNNPCICGSKKKFKKCCWSSYHNKPA